MKNLLFFMFCKTILLTNKFIILYTNQLIINNYQKYMIYSPNYLLNTKIIFLQKFNIFLTKKLPN